MNKNEKIIVYPWLLNDKGITNNFFCITNDNRVRGMTRRCITNKMVMLWNFKGWWNWEVADCLLVVMIRASERKLDFQPSAMLILYNFHGRLLSHSISQKPLEIQLHAIPLVWTFALICWIWSNLLWNLRYSWMRKLMKNVCDAIPKVTYW